MDRTQMLRLDPNRANEQELMDAGLSPERARALVRYREQHGPIGGWDDLDRIPEFDSVEPGLERNATRYEGAQQSTEADPAEVHTTTGPVR